MNKEPQIPWTPLTEVVGPIEESARNIFQLGPISIDREKGYLNFPSTSKLSDIFMSYLPPSLLKNIWESYDVTHWIYGQGKRAGTISKGVFSARLIYTCLAVYIRIIAVQNDQKQTTTTTHLHQSQLTNPQTEQGTVGTDKRNESEAQPSTNLYNGNLTGRPQRAAICEALTYFRSLLISHITNNLLENQESSDNNNGGNTNNQQMISMNAQNEANNKLPGMQAVEIIFSRYHLQRSFWPAICQNFRTALVTPGRCLVGDENLLHFTGSSGFIRIVPTKPDKVGLWFFELVCLLSNSTPYLLHAKLFDTNSNQGTNTIPLNTVVEEWGSIVNEFSIIKESNAPQLSPPANQHTRDLNNANHILPSSETTNSSSVRATVNSNEIREMFSKPILVFDSYYMDEDGRKYLLNSKIPYIATIQPSKFSDLTENFDRFHLKVNKPGQNALLWNEETNEIFLHHYDINMNIGQKYLLSNAFYPRELYHSYFHYPPEPIFSEDFPLSYTLMPMHQNHHHHHLQQQHQSHNFHYPQNLPFNSNIPLPPTRIPHPHILHNHSSVELHHHEQMLSSHASSFRQSNPPPMQHQNIPTHNFHQTSHHPHMTYPQNHNNSVNHLSQQIPVSPPAMNHNKAVATASVIQAVFEATNQIENPSVEYTYIPQQDLFNVYKDIFQTCDLYNQQIHAYKYCHKSGGCHKSGEDGICHKFLMACVLQNTIVAYRSVREKESTEIQSNQESFQELCLQLSDELFLRAMEM